jgi:cytoskeletal protein RodZ
LIHTKNKLPAIRQEAFKNAREALGLSIQDLSQKSCYSVRQIEQIENGESSSFYGAQVKFTAAKKVASLLNLSGENAFDFGDAPQVKKMDVTKSQDDDQLENIQLNDASEKEKVRQTPSSTASKSQAKKFESLPAKSAKDCSPQKKIVLLLGIAAVLVFSIVNLRPLFFPDPVKEEIVVVEEAAPASQPADIKGAASEPVVSATTAPALATSSECPSIDSAAVSYKVDAPKKTGDMVYLQSKTAQSICVIDASGKTQNKTLEPGVGASIYGKPPLKVLTSGQAQVDMYYQGAKVRLSNTATKTIVLEQAEVIQPTTPTDSQLR